MLPVMFKYDEYIKKLLWICNNFMTYYGGGGWGCPANEKNKKRFNAPNAPAGSFIFDCCGFAYKAIPWGWTGDYSKMYGGCTFPVASDPLRALDTMNVASICSEPLSSDFTKILPGEVLYMKGHVAIYIGEGKAIECTSKWTHNVLISQVSNINSGLNMKYKRKWTSHGKLQIIDYTGAVDHLPNDVITHPADEPVYTIARAGEGLIRIAKRSGITFAEIKRLNPNIKGPVYLVRIGQKVRIK